MNASAGSDKTAAARHDLAADQVISIAGRRGTTIHCVHGKIWLTREGDSRDYLLPRGVSFVAAGDGLIVINGQADLNAVVIGHTALRQAGGAAHQALRYGAHLFSELEREARCARSAHMARLFRAGVRALVRCGSRAATLTNLTAQRLRPRRPT
jgi:hypothetical protein